MIPDLRDIWAQDRNGDGIVDYLNARIYVPDIPTPAELAAAANIAARLAFETTSLDLPLGFAVSQYAPDERVSIFVGRAAAGRRPGARTIVMPNLGIKGTDPEFRAPNFRRVAAQQGRNSGRPSLAAVFAAFPEDLQATIVLGPDVRSIAVIDLAARIALESTALRLPLVVTDTAVTDSTSCTILVGRTNPGIQALVSAGKLRQAEQEGTGHIQVVGNCITIEGKDSAGEAEALKYLAGCWPGLRSYGKEHASLASVEEQVRRHTRSKPPDATLIFHDSWSLEWEVDEVRRKIQSQVLPRVKPGSAVTLDVRVSEPSDVRQALAAELTDLLKTSGANVTHTEVSVLCAHKQAFCWIDEILKPQLKGATALRIAYRQLETSPDSVDSKKRWMEELYPIDEVMARDLGITPENVTFHALPPDAPNCYEVVAENALGEIVLRSSFEPRAVVRPLFDLFPDYADATVSTGGFRAIVDAEVVADERIATDYERFWDAYQSRTLPRIREYILQLHGGKPDPERTPHFAELRIDVELSEPDFEPGIDQERISTLEALHEDLYFETLLFFDVLGGNTCGQALRYPGRIVPVVRSAPGKQGRAQVTFTGFDKPFPEQMFRDNDPRVTGIDVQAGKGIAAVEVTAGDAEFCWPLEHVSERLMPHAKRPGLPLVSWDRPIGPQECEHLISQLASFPEVRPFRAGVTFLGQPVWAIDVVAPVEGKYFSQAKTCLSKPCLFLTGRQHANEVSSTSHILKFIELLATSPEHRELLQRVNFIIQPIANPDGAGLVDELYRQMPGFMLHAGYLGALGVDMTEGQWSDCPRYPEARVRADLWRMWRPDIVLNPHGYPSHEWVQLFAGYTAWVHSKGATARDWWIPRGWFMPRFDYIEDERFPGHKLAALMLRDEIAKVVRKSFGSTNSRMYRRYAKYTDSPIALHDGVLINMPSKGSTADPRSASFMKRYPHITFFEALSEAPDEIATGEWLNALAAVGLEVTLAHARFLSELPREIERVQWEEGDRLHLRFRRVGGLSATT